jgi:transcriptional regulator with XRE-family HTH domain
MPNQAQNAVLAAANANIDIAALIPKNGLTLVSRQALPLILEGRSTAEVAEELGMSSQAVSRATQHIATYIRDSLATNGVPEGLTLDMFTPKPAHATERPHEAVMRPVKEALVGRGHTLYTLAERYGVSPTTVQRILNGVVLGKVTLAEALIRDAYDDPEQIAAQREVYIEARRRMLDRQRGRDNQE